MPHKDLTFYPCNLQFIAKGQCVLLCENAQAFRGQATWYTLYQSLAMYIRFSVQHQNGHYMLILFVT